LDFTNDVMEREEKYNFKTFIIPISDRNQARNILSIINALGRRKIIF